MNSNRNLLKRLLRLYPIKRIKEIFEQTGNASDVIEIITGDGTQHAIRDFAFENFTQTKQHIYLYTLPPHFNANGLADFPLQTVGEKHENQSHSYFFLPRVNYKVILSNPLEEEELKFLQPVVIRIVMNTLIIHFTKLEKNVAPYFPEDRNAIRVGPSDHESETLRQIVEYFQVNYGSEPLNINEGVTYLWENNFIDCRKVQWHRNSSTAMETMHEELLFKQEYPEDYEKIIGQPLVKTHFKYIRDDDYFCEDFTADPGSGQISIPKFPKTSNQVDNVLREILENN